MPQHIGFHIVNISNISFSIGIKNVYIDIIFGLVSIILCTNTKIYVILKAQQYMDNIFPMTSKAMWDYTVNGDDV